MFEEQEVVNLIVGLAGLLVLALLARRRSGHGGAVLAGGYACVVAGYLFTVVEGVVLHDLFNLLEHASFAAGGVLFALGLQRLSKPQAVKATGEDP